MPYNSSQENFERMTVRDIINISQYNVLNVNNDDVSLTSLFHAYTGRTVVPLQLPDSQSFQPHHQTSTSVFKY